MFVEIFQDLFIIPVVGYGVIEGMFASSMGCAILVVVLKAGVRNNMVEYKVVLYMEGVIGSLILGASKIDPRRFTDFLNENAAQGWRVVTMEKDIRRLLLLWRREAYCVVMEREKKD